MSETLRMGDLAHQLGVTDIASLPNEILLDILGSLDTLLLLPLFRVSHRFYDLSLRLIYERLTIAAPLSDRMLLFECFHPAARLFEPELLCHYLGTEGLDDVLQLGPSIHGSPPGMKLREINAMYSRFRPRRRDSERRNPSLYRRHPAGDIPGSRTHRDSQTASASHGRTTGAESNEELIKQVVHLDAGSLFMQLSAITSLAKASPTRGLFTSLVPVSDGVIRVFRNWLSEQEISDRKVNSNDVSRAISATGNNAQAGSESDGEGASKDQATTLQDATDPLAGVLWVNDGQNVGVRFRVQERQLRCENPILMHRDEEDAVSYEIQFEEVLVRTRHLLVATERSLYEHQTISDKAMVFGAWV